MQAERMRRMNKTLLYKMISVLLALVLWQLAAAAVDMDMILASPLQVAERLWEICLEGDFIASVFYTLLRILLGFFIAFLSGLVLAVLSGRFRVLEYLLWPYVTAFKSVPVASFIILCLIWFSYSRLTVFIAFLIAFPVIYSNVLQGMKSVNPLMTEMAELYRMPWRRRLLYLCLPSIKPYLISACGVSMGMAWKAGVAAEVIGVISGSIGEKLYEAKVYFLSADLFAWTIVIILLSVAAEKLILFLLEKVFQWVEKR